MQRPLAVGLLAAYLRELLESDPLLADLWLEGEVANVFPARSGHLYFTLRDDDGQIKCALFRSQAARQAVLPRNGDQVALHGRLTFYERDGQPQVVVDLVQPAGLGLAALQLELLRQRLEAEGLFDPARKRPLPPAPRVIGVVTSPDGAVWHDIQTVLRRRYPLVEIVLAAAAVQGDRAPAALVAAIEALQADGRAEVIIVARGGGAAEDLAAFNDERVVRAVFACRVPVVSGVGHETDVTLIDRVADLRAPTPSAAAELCVPSVAELLTRLADSRERLARSARWALEGERRRLDAARSRLRRGDPAAVLAQRRASVQALVRRAERRIGGVLERRRADVALRRDLLRALDPHGVLRRGYAVLIDAETGDPIAAVADTAPGREFIADLHDGALFGRIEASLSAGAVVGGRA